PQAKTPPVSRAKAAAAKKKPAKKAPAAKTARKAAPEEPAAPARPGSQRIRSAGGTQDGDAVLEHLSATQARSGPLTPAGNRGKYVYCIIRSSEFLRFGP